MKRRLALLALLLPALLALAPSAPQQFVGEILVWEIGYAGVTAGTAWARASASGEALTLEGGCQNASWYAAIYSIDDFVRSTWAPGEGSRRYETRFREGGFHQDQDMRLGAEGVEVWRHQRFDEGWRDWTDRYPPSPGAEDPVSALYRLRGLSGEGPWVWPVFTGRKTAPLRVDRLGHAVEDTLFGARPVSLYSLRADHDGDIKQRGRFELSLTDDPRHVPVRAVLHSNLGPIRAELVGYQSATGERFGALPTLP